MNRTRVKICGITRVEDALAAVEAGADAIGLVFYPPSPRYVDIEQARAIVLALPPFVSVVGLFVNAEPGRVRETYASVPLQWLQFHGDEDPAYCRAFGRPYIRAARMRAGVDLLEYARNFADASGLLLDAFVEGYGGGGKTFDWSLIPQALPLPVVLSGGLEVANVGDAISRVKPWAVDVSSGVEAAKGIKDHGKLRAFIAEARHADGRYAI